PAPSPGPGRAAQAGQSRTGSPPQWSRWSPPGCSQNQNRWRGMLSYGLLFLGTGPSAAGAGEAQLVPVFGHRAAGDGDPLPLQQLAQLLVGQGPGLVLPVHQLPEPALDLMDGVPLPGGSHLPGEEEAEGVDPPGALEILFPDGPADGGLVDGQFLGHVAQAQGDQVAAGGAEKGLLPPDDGPGAVQQGGAPLLHRLDDELGLLDLVGEVLL